MIVLLLLCIASADASLRRLSSAQRYSQQQPQQRLPPNLKYSQNRNYSNIPTTSSAAQSTASLNSSASDWAPEEHVSDLGIKLQPGTPLYQINVEDLHPTQLCVGMQQVHEKMKKLQKKLDKGPAALDKFLRSHPVPVVLGPGGRHYLIDHHHLARAMYEKGLKSCYAGTVLDLTELTQEQFWVAMARRNLLWSCGCDGSPVEVKQLAALLPDKVADLADDPYRSLAALVRKAGGYQKSNKPFSEFIWANHLRSRVPMVLVAVPDVETYVQHAISHAQLPEASALPGYTLLTPAAPIDPQQRDAPAMVAPVMVGMRQDEAGAAAAGAAAASAVAAGAAAAGAAAPAALIDPQGRVAPVVVALRKVEDG